MEPMSSEEMKERIRQLEAERTCLRLLLHNAHETLKYTSKWHSQTPLGRDIEEMLN